MCLQQGQGQRVSPATHDKRPVGSRRAPENLFKCFHFNIMSPQFKKGLEFLDASAGKCQEFD